MKTALNRIRDSLAMAFVAALLCGVSPAMPAGVGPQEEAGPLEYAFKFASAIKSDPKDMGKMQQAVVLDYAHVGEIDTAVERSGSIVGWRRGVVCAELARQLALQGRSGEARALIAEAEGVRKGIEGWENPRIASHIARALAALGDEESRKMSAALAEGDPVQYSGRSTAIVASSLATEGEFDEAMKRLETLETDEEVDAIWWRTMGYLDLARRKEFAADQKDRALAAARKSADSLDGSRRADALLEVVEEFRLRGNMSGAREGLEAMETIATQIPDTDSVKARLLGDVARGWSRAGERERGARLLEGAMTVVPNALSIDKPGLYAEVASSYMVIGEQEKAWTVYDTAFDSAEALASSRPRAMAVVSICRSMGRNGVALNEETRSRLDSLYAGLADPS